MNVVEFTKELSAQGVELWRDGDRLRYRAPKEVLTPTLLTKIKHHKADILKLLSEGAKTFPLSQSVTTAIQSDHNLQMLPLQTVPHQEKTSMSFAQQKLWFLDQFEQESSFYTLYPIQTNGTRPPFFWFHSEVITFLPGYIGEDQPLYAFVAQGIDGERARYKSAKEITAHYIREMRTVQPSGPYYLGGFCWGGRYAFEIAQQMIQQGEDVALLFVVEPALASAHSNQIFLKKYFPQFTQRLMEYGIDSLSPGNVALHLLFMVRRRFFRIVSEAYLRTGRTLPPSLRVPYALDVIIQAYRDFVQKTYPKDIILIQAEKGDHPADSDWSNLAEGEVTVHLVPGATHMDMLEGTGKVVWAKWLNTYLRKAQEKYSGTKI